ncbi:glycosyltransferase family 2 protein [Thermosynechococcus vestitus]|uniref:Tlr0127 protein n=1 Tax=Thermosynechococcus vestitus (strain NIES-2133 / IAM M-273 / BP-1) TaxID=197221 RepID=Q8DMI9_THEVB|nr:glycosyltransferase [Thermosynechococcus vestitus]BAC07680.1 tlr0127 [Thermosynechococcus vestitus BP-1]
MDYATNCASLPKWHKVPLLSVCIPAYNRPQGLVAAVRSVVAALPREYHDQVEIVITDDSATRTAVDDLLAPWSGHWHYQHNAQRLGMVANWNTSLAKACGEFILLLHDDDYLLPQGITTILATLSQYGSQFDVFLFGVHLVDSHQRCLRRQIPRRQEWLSPAQALRQLLRHSSLVRFPALIWRRSLLDAVGYFDPTYGEATDLYQWLRFFAQKGVYTVPCATAAYRIHDQALTMGMFQAQTLATLGRIFAAAADLSLLSPAELRHCQCDFFHQFILAGTWRFLRRRQWQRAQAVYQLFDLPEVIALGRSRRWQGLRWLLGSWLWLLQQLSS